MRVRVAVLLVAGMLLSGRAAPGQERVVGDIPTPHAPAARGDTPTPWKPASEGTPSTVRVFKYDGSRQCGFAAGISLEEMGKELHALGVTPVSQQKIAAPIMINAACGLPTGWANVYTIALQDLPKINPDPASNGAFSIWLFDSKSIFVAKYDGSLQCMGGGVSPDEMAKELTAVGIRVLDKKNVRDGLKHMTLCGASTGMMNAYEISAVDYPAAKVLGFIFMGTKSTTPSMAIAGDDLFPWPW
jgi:hypothetical protein